VIRGGHGPRWAAEPEKMMMMMMIIIIIIINAHLLLSECFKNINMTTAYNGF
jgi:hypothetical protein